MTSEGHVIRHGKSNFTLNDVILRVEILLVRHKLNIQFRDAINLIRGSLLYCFYAAMYFSNCLIVRIKIDS